MMNFKVKKLYVQLQVILLLIPASLVSQSSKEIKNIFAKAESYYLYEEYELANQLYLLIETPENMNLKYKIGVCYLNIPSEKDKAIPYLEDAVKSASYDSKTELISELRAPLDAYYFLAKAYMINNEFEKAILTFNAFSKLAKESKGKMKNLDYVDQQIQACKNAIQFSNFHASFVEETLGSDFNIGSINENPAVSFDGNTIVYTERRGIVNVIFFSKKENGKWLPPVEITSQLNAGEDCSSCSLNKDGTELFLYKTDNYDGVLYSSNYINNSWTPIKKLNKNINTKFYESHASISADGKRLYFASNREGGEGNLDIYVSEKDGTGDWGPAVNMGNTINTPYNEDNPFITENDSLFYFCSEGHNSMGGFDNFKCRKSGSGWTSPINLGPPVNSTDDDKFFQPINNGENGYYSLITDYKRKNIFYITWDETKSTFKITGKLMLDDSTLSADKNYSVKVVNKSSGDTIVTSPDKKSGLYSIEATTGDIEILYTGEGYLTHTIDTSIVSIDPETGVTLNVILHRDTGEAPVPAAKIEDIDLSDLPVVAAIDSGVLVRDLDANDTISIDESDVLYYTVQVIALHKPGGDKSYFKNIDKMKVIYNENDKFFRYTTGQFKTKDEAYSLRSELIKKGYPEEIFVKKVTK